MDERVWHRAYDTGVPVSLDYDGLTIPACLERSVASYPDAPALIFANRLLSYRVLGDEVARFATALSRLGVAPGTRVAIQLPNLPQTVIAYYAVLSLGAQVVMTNPLYVERELEHQWNDAGCAVAIITDYLYARRIRAIRRDLGVRHYVVASIPDYLTWPTRWLASIKLALARPPLVAWVQTDDDVHAMSALMKRTDAAPPTVEVDLDSDAVIQYTGGTTGVSKEPS